MSGNNRSLPPRHHARWQVRQPNIFLVRIDTEIELGIGIGRSSGRRRGAAHSSCRWERDNEAGEGGASGVDWALGAGVREAPGACAASPPLVLQGGGIGRDEMLDSVRGCFYSCLEVWALLLLVLRKKTMGAAAAREIFN